MVSPEDRVLRIINDGWLVLLLSLGERAGWLKQLAIQGPCTADELSAATRVPARYLQEWAWGLVAGGLLDHDEASGTFAIPEGFEDVLTDRGGPAHWSRISEQIVAFADLEDDLLECFWTGRGIDPARYNGRLAEVMDLESGPIFDRVLNELVPLIGCQEVLERGARVVDLGCGSGRLVLTLAKQFPHSNFTGFDLSVSALEKATQRAAETGLGNCTFTYKDLEPLELDDTYDIAFCCNTAHDLPSPPRFFKALLPRLRPGGVLVLQELHASTNMTENARNPLALGILAFSLFHCVPLALRKDPAVLAPGGMWGRERYVDALRASGFTSVTAAQLPGDPANDFIVARRTPPELGTPEVAGGI